MKVVKSFGLSYAHALPTHPGKCKRLHGHNARVEVEIEGKVQSTGMVLDFGDISSRLITPVMDLLDHKTILQDIDPHCDYWKNPNISTEELVVLSEFPPTAEVLANLICRLVEENLHQWILEIFPKTVYPPSLGISIRFWETDTCYVESSDSKALAILTSLDKF